MYYWCLLRFLARNVESAWKSAPEHSQLITDAPLRVIEELQMEAERVWTHESTPESVLSRMDGWESRIQESGLDSRRMMICAVENLNVMHRVDMDLSVWAPEVKPRWSSRLWKCLTRG